MSSPIDHLDKQTREQHAAPETVTILKSYYLSLLDDQDWRTAYEDAGVDNWEGADYANETYHRLIEDQGARDA